MKDVVAWSGVMVAMVVLTLCLALSTGGTDSLSRSAVLARLSSADFTVPTLLGQTETVNNEERNPFRYAPVSEPGQFDTPMSAFYQANMDFPILALEGVLLRRSKKQAFVRYESYRRAVAVGDEIAEGFSVETIDKESMVVTNLWGKSRRYYITP